MQSVSRNSLLDVSASVLASYSPCKENCIASEDSAVAVETVFQDPEKVIAEKTVVLQKTLVLKEKVILPKETFCNPQVFVCPPCPSAACMQYSLEEEMDFGSQASLKMELGSQGSADVKMEMSSQESISSKMDVLSQENNCESPVSRCCPEDESRRSKRKSSLEEASWAAEEAFLSVRENDVALREAAVHSREALLKIREDNLENHKELIKSKRLKKCD